VRSTSVADVKRVPPILDMTYRDNIVFALKSARLGCGLAEGVCALRFLASGLVTVVLADLVDQMIRSGIRHVIWLYLTMNAVPRILQREVWSDDVVAMLHTCVDFTEGAVKSVEYIVISLSL
jgi:hypothetical protein